MTSWWPTRSPNRDTVEEFWDADLLDRCRDRARRTSPRDFLDALKVFLQADGSLWSGASARVTLRDFLRQAVAGTERAVWICSFNCSTVADAVREAGCAVETYDLADREGRIDWASVAERLDKRCGAVIVPHFFGVPTDFEELRVAAARRGALVIEDCAHTLGGTIRGRTAGTLGDAAIFSFNYDKPLSLGGGGVFLLNNPQLQHLVPPPRPAPTADSEWHQLHTFRCFLRDRRRRIRIPRTGWERRWQRITRRSAQRPTPLPPAEDIGPLRAALGLALLEQYPAVLRRRNDHAGGFRGWPVGSTVHPAWLKQRLVPAMDAAQVSQTLRQQGIRAGNFNWPVTVDAHLGRAERPLAAHIAHRGMDIPIHQNMTDQQLAWMRAILNDNKPSRD